MVLEMNEYGHNQEKLGSKNWHDEVMDWVIHTLTSTFESPGVMTIKFIKEFSA